MLALKPDEIVIHGTTSKGKTFRPSDWSERLCGILSSFDKGHRLSYHQWVRPMLMDKVRCVAVDKQLEEINPSMFHFLMDFAADNDLRVLDYEATLKEEGVAKEVSPEKAASKMEASPDHQPVDINTAAVSSMREIGIEETSVAFAALSVLRPMLTDINRFVEQVNNLQRTQGYRLIGIFEEGKNNAVAVCGFRQETNLVSGRHIHIDDIVTIPQSRGKGHAARLLQEVKRIAAEEGIQQIHIDSNVGSERVPAHRLYFDNGFEISAHHFILKIEK